MAKPKTCACTSHCPCQVKKPRKRRNHAVVPHRPNVIQDLLALLIADKYKEPINKPPLVVSTPTLFSSSEKKDATTATEAIEAPPPSPSPALATFSEGLALLEKQGGGGGRRESISSYQESEPGSLAATEDFAPRKFKIVKPWQVKSEEQQVEEVRSAVRKKKKETPLAMGGLLQTLQEATDKESESGNVEFS